MIHPTLAKPMLSLYLPIRQQKLRNSDTHLERSSPGLICLPKESTHWCGLGVTNNEGVLAVGERRFDSVRHVGISPNLEHLNFVASQGGFEFVYHKGKDYPSYLKIKDYSVHGPNDNAAYIGRHVLSLADNSQKADVFTTERYIEHVVNGEDSTPWFEAIRGIKAGDDLSNTTFVGYQDGKWAVHKGPQ